MFYKYNDLSVRTTGRWGDEGNRITATASGSKLEIAFKGEMAVMHFDTFWNSNPAPHLWVMLDGGNKIEVPIDRFLRIECENSGEHFITVILKGEVEQQHRWYSPLIAKISFMGYEADENGKLPENNKKTIEFVGDSITEGVLIDDSYRNDKNEDQNNRVYQDDVTATYAYLTAKNLDLEPLCMGYGAVGLTHGGCGSVPSAVDAYPYCFNGMPVTYNSPDFILINHGTNDMWSDGNRAGYIPQYEKLLNLIYEKNSKSKVIAMIPFCGAFHDELIKFIPEYNKKYNKDVLLVDTTGWLEAEPVHPLRDGHKIAAEKLTAILREKYSL